jgi:hypothetical protein
MQIMAAHRILSAPVVAAGEGHDASETFKANTAGEEIICFVVSSIIRLSSWKFPCFHHVFVPLVQRESW